MRKRRRGTYTGSTIETLESGERVIAKKAQDSGFQDEDEGNRVVKLKVSSDGGETWLRRKVNMGVDLEDSGLRCGEIFKMQDEQYEVVPGDDGMRAEPAKKTVSRHRGQPTVPQLSTTGKINPGCAGVNLLSNVQMLPDLLSILVQIGSYLKMRECITSSKSHGIRAFALS